MNSPSQLCTSSESRKIVRRASVDDIEAVQKLANEIPTVAQWSRAVYETYCAGGQQSGTQAKALFIACVLSQDRALLRKEIVGFAAFSAIPDLGIGECELENMAVAEPWRRQGIASRLLTAGQLWCRAWCPAHPNDGPAGYGLSLEVRASNRSAIAFYERAGFKANGCRPGYYKQPDEDAVLMWKSLNGPL